MLRWQFGIQQTFPGGFLVGAGYVGNRGTRIESNRDLNAIANSFLSTDLIRATTMVASNNYLAGNLTNPFRGLVPVSASNLNAGPTRSRSALLRAAPSSVP